MSSSSRQRQSQAPPPNVNLYCSSCNSQIGIFDNEWIRLTSSYARARTKGTHFGIETGKKVKTVPQGPAQKAAEGCGMSEVFCTKCSSLIGQYCRTAPDGEKQQLINQYFYKTSRTYLKDAQTSEAVDFAFGYTGDLSLPPPKPMIDAGPRKSTGFTPRQSQTPLPPMPNGGPMRDSLGSYGFDGSLPAFNAVTPSPYVPFGAPVQQFSDSRPSLDRHVPVNQATLTELANLRGATEQHGRAIQQLQYDFGVLMAGHMQSNQGTMQVAGPMQGLGSNVPFPANDELNALREENRKMKERLATIASAMGIAAADPPMNNFIDGIDRRTTRAPDSTLGKRKRVEDDQLPTPHSTQSSNRSREVSYAGPYFPAFQPGADFSLEGEVVMDDDAQWNNYAAQSAISNPPAIAGPQTTNTAFYGGTGQGPVEFSDDEVPGLHFPTVEPVPPAHETIQQYKARMRALRGLKPEPLDPGSMEVEPYDFINMDHAEHWSIADVARMIEEEKLPPPPKEPREPKERIQSTEKYLNAELVELGLTQWIGKDKRDPAYKVAISAARTAHKEAKKIEALARRGLRPAQLPQPEFGLMSDDSSDEESSDGHYDTELHLNPPMPVPRTTHAPPADDIDELAAPVPARSLPSPAARRGPVRASVAPVEKANTKGRAKTPSARSRRPSRKAQPVIEGDIQPSNKKPRAKPNGRPSSLAQGADTPLQEPGEPAAARAPQGSIDPLLEGAKQPSMNMTDAGDTGLPSESPMVTDTPLEKPVETAETPVPKDLTQPLVEAVSRGTNKKPRPRRSEAVERELARVRDFAAMLGAAGQENQTEPSVGHSGPNSSKKPRRARKSAALTKGSPTPVDRSEERSAAPIPKDTTAPLAEVTSQHQNRALGLDTEQQDKAPANISSTSKLKSMDEGEIAQENQSEDRMMTRHQQRKAQIQRMDQMAQEAMELEEA